jgi:transportin-3
MDSVLQALQALHSSSASPELRKQADQWLVSFQRSPESWSLCADILQADASGSELLLFAAQTIRYKATRQLAQVTIDQLPAIREQIISSLLRITAPQTSPISHQLCLALVGVSFRWHQWEDVVEQVSHRLPPHFCVEFLQLLAEEARDELGSVPGVSTSSSVTTDVPSIRSRVCSWSHAVFSTLQQALQLASSSSSERLLVQLLCCLGSWAKLGALEQQLQTAAVMPLLAAAVQSLHSATPQVGTWALQHMPQGIPQCD